MPLGHARVANPIARKTRTLEVHPLLHDHQPQRHLTSWHQRLCRINNRTHCIVAEQLLSTHMCYTHDHNEEFSRMPRISKYNPDQIPPAQRRDISTGPYLATSLLITTSLRHTPERLCLTLW